MEVKQTIKLDMAQLGSTPRLYAKQGDTARVVEIILQSGGSPWIVPEGTTPIVRYRKADGTTGMYDTLPDGSTPAATVDGNVLSVNLAPQMLTCPGAVQCDVVLVNAAEVLATFDFWLVVEQPPTEGTDTSSQNYYKVLALNDLNTLLGKFEEKIEHIQRGQPDPVTCAADMADTSRIYLYLGSEDGYDFGHIYVYQNGVLVNTGLYGKGQDGETPNIHVAKTAAGIDITVNGSVYTVKNGTNGQSPTLTVAEIPRGHRVTVSDANGTSSFDVLDGAQGLRGEPGVRQLDKPDFAASIDECTDTSKMYVLPDGYIYAYRDVPAVVAPDTSLTWSVGTKIDTSTGAESASSTYAASNYIALVEGWTYTVKRVTNGYDAKVCYYDSNKNFLSCPSSGILSTNGQTTANIPAYAGAGYFRVRAYRGDGITESRLADTTITATSGSGGAVSGWYNTGHAFVPADYEDRILAVEAKAAENAGNISALMATGNGAGDAPDYVVTEANRVAREVLSRQNGNTFSFLAIADAHYYAASQNIIHSVVHAGQGMDLVRKGVAIDFGAVLGDNGWCVSTAGAETSVSDGLEQIRFTNQAIDASLRGIPNFRTPGNHDSLIFNYSVNGNTYLDSGRLFPLYGAYNAGAVFQSGQRQRGYCYRDFGDWKVRVICLNTSDIQDIAPKDVNTHHYLSGTQLKWFAEALDLSAKSDASEWGILLLAHAPLDWDAHTIRAANILHAYETGGTVSLTRDGVTFSYNYAGKNRARIIAQIHGHTHGFKVDNLHYLDASNNIQALTAKRVAIPNACFDRTNQYGQNGTAEGFGIEFGDDTACKKTGGTAEDTSFCVITVDTAARKIYATHYGAGVDRVVSY